MICAGEFDMADEAFALSPISARAAQPRDEDYEAIREAFMETARGRWFLLEYAKRNRNADTRMVLDAVARIEETLAAHKQPEPENRLAEALVAIKGALDQARRGASAVLDRSGLAEALAPVRKGARIIKEISWRWREIGADGRICDLIDSQVSAIEAACGHFSSSDPGAALSAAFDLIEQQIGEFCEQDPSEPPVTEEAAPQPSPAPPEEMSATPVQTTHAIATANEAEAAMSASAMPDEAGIGTARPVEMTAEVTDVTAETVELAAEPADVTAEAAQAHDEAILDMIALEMAAPDPSDADERFDTDAAGIHVEERSLPSDPEILAQQPEPTAPTAPPPILQASLEYSPSLQHSLGSTLIESGIVPRPSALQPDPFAPIRRMSQAEKIAFFS
jgi:hypothetical protein